MFENWISENYPEATQILDQRWPEKGTKNVLKLRVSYMSNQWHKIINLIQHPTAQAA